MNSLLRFAIILSMIIFIACDPVTLTSEDPANLIKGEWNWQKTEYFFTVTGQAEVLTPASEGYTETFVFGADGLFSVYKDGDLSREGTYWFDTLRSNIQGEVREDVLLYIKEGGVERLTNYEFTENNNVLIFDGSAADGPKVTLERVVGD